MEKHIIAKTLLMLASLTFAASTAVAADTGSVPWSYSGTTGPKAWGELSLDYKTCDTGKQQSPIDIETSVPLKQSALTVHYPSIPMDIIDNGHTIQLSTRDDNQNTFISINQQKYRLVQFHFHAPSETTIHHEKYPLEIHFVNQNSANELTVIAVFIKEGGEGPNPALQKIIDSLPKTKDKTLPIKSGDINLTYLLPNNSSYYNFMGSLTTPPCSEKVNWFVMTMPAMATKEQIKKLVAAMPENNARPIQPVNGRTISNYKQP